ncbi:MAG TPA: chromosomal replication initiator protein DnaA [Candidatus Kapabacteria bacterium]|nr:chromosomal replication initiator protein DnaA [Candidatus Kapabacteria bacterium]
MISTLLTYDTKPATAGTGDQDASVPSSVAAYAPREAWDACLEIVQGSITHQAFKTWFEPTKAIRLEEATLTVQVPSRFFYEWIEEHYYGLLRKSIVQVLGEGARLIYHAAGDDVVETAYDRAVTLPVRTAEHASDAPQRRTGPVFSPIASSMFQQPVRAANQAPAQQSHAQAGAPPQQSYLNPRYTFENFITGDCNQLAYAAAQAIADNPGGTRFNPLVVYGGVGLGKTHLVQAIGHAILGARPNCSVVYTSSERFTYEFVNAIQHNKSQEFTNYYRSVDVLIVDDIQFFADKEKTQDNFFHTFNALHQYGKQIILTSDVPPKQLRGVDDRLISRFQWGLTTDIQPPDLETRIAILQKMSTDEGYQLPGDVIDYIARNVTTSVRELEGCLISLLAECSLRNLSLTLDLTREVISGIASVPEQVVNVEQIQSIVCTQLNIPHSLLVGKTRKQEIVFARQVAMYLIRELTGASLKTIGNHFGGRDHTTVMHAISTIETQRTRDDHTRRILSAARRELGVNDR